VCIPFNQPNQSKLHFKERKQTMDNQPPPTSPLLQLHGEKNNAHAVATHVSNDDWKHVFRIITARQNQLVEIFPNPVYINIRDIGELNELLRRKASAYELLNNSFTCIVSYVKLRTQQIVSWEQFSKETWATSEIIESLTLRWEFIIKFPGEAKPCPFMVTVRCATTPRPQDMIQFLFSKDEEEIDLMQLKTATMSCKVDFSEPMISQELLDIVAGWNRARRSPESSLPGLKWCCHRSHHIANIIRKITPIITFGALLAYYSNYANKFDSSQPATHGFMAYSLIWLSLALISFYVSGYMAKKVGDKIEKSLNGMLRFHVFEITHGDKQRLTKMAAETSKSFWKFIGSGLLSLLWNIIATYLCIKFLS